jgi:hypothetical protein
MLLHYMVNFSLSVLGTPLLALTLVVVVAATLVILLDRRVGWFRQAPLLDVRSPSAES